MEWLRDWAGPLAAVLSVGSIVYAWLTSRSKGNEEKIRKHEEKLTDHDRRIQQVESDIQHVPSKDDLHDLRVGLEQVKGALGRLEESSNGTDRSVRRIEAYLLKDK